MQWLEALEQYRVERGIGNQPAINCAIVEKTPAPPALQDQCKVIGDWLIEERQASRGNIALYLFPFPPLAR